jgi:hypothetical protein
LKQFTNSKISIRYRSGGLSIRVCSKDFFNRFLQFGFHSGERKLEYLDFLNKIKSQKRKFILRGLVDTDGCVIKRTNGQVFMEIATCSKFLASWINGSLKALNFRCFITKYTNKKNQTIYRVWLSGKENIRKWVALIGFSNKYKFDKAVEILREGL